MPLLGAAGDSIDLPAEEAEHLTRVLRLSVGAAVRVFDGRGREHAAVVEDAGRHRARVRIGDQVVPAPEVRVAVTLAQAVLKGDGMDDVVRDAVMMGVTAIVPLLTAHTETTAAALERGRRRERWERIAVSSAKQCGRAVVPVVADPRTFESVVSACDRRGLAIMLVEPDATSQPTGLDGVDPTPPLAATLLTGPEGGWSPAETAHAVAACRLLTLGGRTLRADAMATVALAALFARWNEF